MSPKQGVRNPPNNQEGLQALKVLLNSYQNNQEVKMHIKFLDML